MRIYGVLMRMIGLMRADAHDFPDAHLQSHNLTDMCDLGKHLLQPFAEGVRWCSGDGGEPAGGEPQKPRHTPEDSHTLDQIRNLKHGCCVVMLRQAYCSVQFQNVYFKFRNVT